MQEQPGDHSCSESNDQPGLFGGRNDCGIKTATTSSVRLLQQCEWLQQPDHLRYIAMQLQLFSAFFLLISLFDSCLVIESQSCRVITTMSQCIRTSPLKLLFFTSFLTQFFSISYLMLLVTSHFLLWLLQTSCSIFIVVACCYTHSRVFYACCSTLLCILPLFWLSC